MSKSFLLLALLVVVSESQRVEVRHPRPASDTRGHTAAHDAGAHRACQRG
jgi:hypothetical protein